MSNRTIPMTDALYAYLVSVTLREPDLFQNLREETAKLPYSEMQISPEQGQFMGLLIELLGARQVIEVGTYTGYSALWMASALPDNGLLVACDVNEEWTSIGRTYWEKAGVVHKIELRIAPGVETLQELLDEGQSGTFDFAFIDADKTSYGSYYELSLQLLRRGGLVAVDNTLWDGKVADPQVGDPDTVAIRNLNLKVSEDHRVTSSLVPIGDGLLLARKR